MCELLMNVLVRISKCSFVICLIKTVPRFLSTPIVVYYLTEQSKADLFDIGLLKYILKFSIRVEAVLENGIPFCVKSLTIRY